MPQPKPLPPVELLRELFDYDPTTGILTNRVRRSNRLPGDRAGTRRPDGYWLIGINKRVYLLHRVAWKHYFGTEPSFFLDHKDRNPGNNTINNLRITDYSGNAANSSRANKKLAGTRKEGNRWSARSKHLYHGMFDTEEEAHQAYVQWHLQKFGKFSIYAP